MNQSEWSSLTRIVDAQSKRASSWDRTGRNHDCIRVGPGETTVLADIAGAGVITHIYFTIIDPDLMDYRDTLIRMYWDGEETPSVDVPLGDFFCISNCTVRRFSSSMMAINLGGAPHTINNGINCYFPMPFANGARVELVNESSRILGGNFGRLWYHIDYEERPTPPPEDVGRFHAQWRRENLTVPPEDSQIDPGEPEAANLTGDDNYVMLEAEGAGHIAGLFLQVENVQGGWYGEGDDMIFIDGDTWPPSMHGTGSEEVFGGGACPDKEYAGVHTGFLLVENRNGETFKGKNAMYRWYTQDPVRFRQSVKMTIEHGHANDYANDYASVVYWYQQEPHAPFPAMKPLEERRPRMVHGFYEAHAKGERLNNLMLPIAEKLVAEKKINEIPEWYREAAGLRGQAYALMYEGEYDNAATEYDKALELVEQNQ